MGGAITKFVAQAVECDFRDTYCPKCQTTCDQCGKAVTPQLSCGPQRRSADYQNGTIMFADCIPIGICQVQGCDLPSAIHGKHLINVRCLECDQITRYCGGGQRYHNFMMRSRINDHFDLTKEEYGVKKLPPIVKPNLVKKCCKNCDDSDENMIDIMIRNYQDLPYQDMTSYYMDDEADWYDEADFDNDEDDREPRRLWSRVRVVHGEQFTWEWRCTQEIENACFRIQKATRDWLAIRRMRQSDTSVGVPVVMGVIVDNSDNTCTTIDSIETGGSYIDI